METSSHPLAQPSRTVEARLSRRDVIRYAVAGLVMPLSLAPAIGLMSAIVSIVGENRELNERIGPPLSFAIIAAATMLGGTLWWKLIERQTGAGPSRGPRDSHSCSSAAAAFSHFDARQARRAFRGRRQLADSSAQFVHDIVCPGDVHRRRVVRASHRSSSARPRAGCAYGVARRAGRGANLPDLEHCTGPAGSPSRRAKRRRLGNHDHGRTDWHARCIDGTERDDRPGDHAAS